MEIMKPTLFLSILFGFLCCNLTSSKYILADSNYTEIEVTDGGTVIGNVKYMGELATVGLNLYRSWELSDTSKTNPEKLVFSKVNNGLKKRGCLSHRYYPWEKKR
ncbi:MAG: hypothetical protein AYP45_07490 [Candidatus Brocadia carolinensis]|uniref:Uncharacterized protein n=1 Tax=Candidatus Brocadia carolinensis TaxID=1004156 RepID=A0A1V4AU89_9BACT|nr:MAG: hypothetical protein AYP45_07490 [Candidatus Brocadia caroliniensis]